MLISLAALALAVADTSGAPVQPIVESIPVASGSGETRGMDASAPLAGEEASSTGQIGAEPQLAMSEDAPRDTTAPALAPDAGGKDQRADASEIVVTARPSNVTKADPLAEVNEVTFAVVQDIDKAVIGPVAMGYKSTVPKPIRRGLRNFFVNLSEPIVFLNFMLQLKPGKAAETAARFAVNSTVGVGGLVDVAKRKPINLPYRPNGFGNTLGYYGVKPGPYFFLPLVGPITLRDGIGRILDLSLLPAAVGSPFNTPAFTVTRTTLVSIDERAEFDASLKKLRESSNSYASVRAYYLERRQAEIDRLRGRTPAEPVIGSAP